MQTNTNVKADVKPNVNGNADASSSKVKILQIPESSLQNLQVQPAFDYHSLDGQDPVICIDNGSHSFRAGFSTMSTPYIDRPSIVARYKERKLNRTIMLFGRDSEVDANSRSNARPLYDGDLLVNGDMLECALDYTFSKLGIDTDGIQHPIVMTEKLANPLFTRAMTSEMLFELYGAPSVAYGIDSLFAFSRQKHMDGIAISLGHYASTVIPVVGGRGIMSRAKRIPWGGAQASELLLKLAQLKYPSFPVKVTPSQATFMYRETCYFSSDYDEELRSFENPTKLAESTVVVQFPYAQNDAPEKTQEELDALAEKRKESGRRLQEMQAKQRAEKLAAKVAELEEYKLLLSEKSTMKKSDFLQRLSDYTPFETEAELERWIKSTELEIRRKERKDLGEEEPEEDPVFPLLEKPDSELNEDEIKEKRKQRLMKASWEARVKIREEKRRERERLDEIQRKDDEERINNLAGWSAKLKAEQEAVILRMRERKKRRAQLGDRKSAAAQSRMKSIASLASDDPVPAKKKRKGDDDDGFGRDDSDWHVYREIGGDDDSEAEEEDLSNLSAIEQKLLQYDPTFTTDQTHEGRIHASNALINSFVRGGTDGRFDSENTAQAYQIHLNVERIRVPEAWFQPDMFGVDSAGIGEVAGWLLNGYEEEQRRRMMECIYLTGGGSAIPNLPTRIRNTLTPVLPFRAPLKIVTALDDPRLEAWRGMSEWSKTKEGVDARITKAEYDEYGQEWIKEHAWGNVGP